MRLPIQKRLFLAFLAASALAVLGMFLIMQWSIDRGFLRYVNTLEQERLTRLGEELTAAYDREGSWAFLRERPATWLRLMLHTLPEGTLHPERLQRLERRLERREDQGRPFPPEERRRGFGQRFEARAFLLDAQGNRVAGPPEIPPGVDTRPLVQDGRTTGYLGIVPAKELTEVHQLRFVKEQKVALALVGAVVLLSSALLSFLLSRRLVRPLRALAGGTRRLAGGDYAARVRVDSQDELGQLAADFNVLAGTLEKNEQARRQWIADISHELRTPLAVLRGELEALQDGVRRPDETALASLHGEILRLTRLVDDLYELALSDIGALTYRKKEVDFGAVLSDALEEFRGEFALRHIEVRHRLSPEKSVVFADPERLHQLFANLLSNAWKYTDPGGALEVEAGRQGDWVVADFRDSAPGVPPGDLERLFERLYRVESSRSRESGGAGLGLAICRNIAEAHGGTIEAMASPLGGVCIRLRLPLQGGKG